MDKAKLRAFWAKRQGLDGALKGKSPSEVLERAGWARSVGGANPYLTLFARAGTTQKQAEDAAKAQKIHELPSARGCTYVLPARDFALGLLVGQGFGDAAAINVAKKHLGVTDKEIDRLCEKVVKALGKDPMDPKAIKEAVGDAVRSFGEEGKKRGITTSLPLALGLLQTRGEVRRVPIGGRLDQQRYGYVAWSPSPLAKNKLSQEEAHVKLAERYWSWIGVASLSDFKWFSGLGVGAVKAATAPLKLVAVEGVLLATKETVDEFKAFKVPKEPRYVLTADLDSLVLLRRGMADLVDDKDRKLSAHGEKGKKEIAAFLDLPHHAIYDRGRLVGFWEFDVPDGQIVWKAFVKPDAALKNAVAEMEKFVQGLGDARSFSLDSPESRKPRVASLRG
jgi:hypothetical protein